MITLSFEEVAVDTKQPHFLKMAVGFLGSFTTYGFNQGFTCLYTAARKVPALKVGMPNE